MFTNCTALYCKYDTVHCHTTYCPRPQASVIQPYAGCRLCLQDLNVRRLQNGIADTPADDDLADYSTYKSGSKIREITHPSTVQLQDQVYTPQPTTSSVELICRIEEPDPRIPQDSRFIFNIIYSPIQRNKFINQYESFY